jgi:dolichol kinase
MDLSFFTNLSVQIFSLWLLQYLTGNLVFYKDVKVGYTRKINHFGLFFLPLYLDTLIPYESSVEGFILKSIVVIFCLLIYSAPLRSRVPIVARMFLSFDRPEDRPHTLLWLSTQIAAGYLILVPAVLFFEYIGIAGLVLIPILITGIGDGLAEPVGIRFGKHKYKTHALFSKTKYERSIEGSMCVFITSIVTIMIFQSSFTTAEFIIALLTVPVIMTLTEAWSPHTWDTPFLFFIGYFSLYLIKTIPILN